jgi:hypothetical protein
MALPTAAEAVEAARTGTLDQYAPDINALADTATLAAWLGISPRSIHRERQADRARAGGRHWPDPVTTYGRTPVWTYRQAAEYRATMPGPGNRTERKKGTTP